MPHRRVAASSGLVDRRTVLKGIGATAGAGLVAGCIGDDEIGDAVTIGAIQPFTGPFAPWGEAHSAGLNYKFDEVNANGGVLGAEIELVESDTGSDPGEADTIFRRLVEEDDAVAITGAVSSDVGVATRVTAEELLVPNILHMAGSPGVIDNDTRYVFRVGSHSNVTDTMAIVGLIEEQGYTQIGAVHADYEWGRSFEAALQQLAPGGVTIHEGMAAVGESDFTPFLDGMPEDMELLLATGHPPGSIAIHNQAIELGFEHDYTTGAGFPPGVLREGLGENAATFAHQHVADPFSEDFVEVATRFAEATGDRFDTHEAYGWIAGELIVNGIEATESTDPTDIADGIRETTHDTLLRNPIEYAQWGEVDNLIHMLSSFVFEPPEYFPDGDWRLDNVFASDPLPAFDPGEWDF